VWVWDPCLVGCSHCVGNTNTKDMHRDAHSEPGAVHRHRVAFVGCEYRESCGGGREADRPVEDRVCG